MRISETFETIQGEGPFTGTPSFFIRLQGCSVGCCWCDTKYTWDRNGGDSITVPDLVKRVKDGRASCRLVVITGGEPLEEPLFEDLVNAIAPVKRVQIESAAVRPRPKVDADFVLSPKLPSVTPKWRSTWDHITTYDWSRDWIKIVVGSENDCWDALHLIDSNRLPHDRVWLMPIGLTRGQLVESSEGVWEYCVQTGFRFSGRQHIWVHGPKRRT